MCHKDNNAVVTRTGQVQDTKTILVAKLAQAQEFEDKFQKEQSRFEGCREETYT